MRYSFDEIHALNLLSDDESYSKHFNTPNDLKIMTGIILFCAVAVVTAASVFKVDKIVPAQGVLDTRAELFEINNTQPGFIESILVKEGDLVEEGQLLVQFETQLVQLEIDSLSQQLKALSRNLWNNFYQIEPYLENQDKGQLLQALLSIPNPIADLGYQRYLAKPFANTAQISMDDRKSIAQQVLAAKRQQRLIEQRLYLQRQELKRTVSLFKEGIESGANVDLVKAQVLELQSSLVSIKDSLQNLAAQKHKSKQQLSRTQSEYLLERFLRIHDQLDSYHSSEFQLTSQRRSLADLSIRAPISGTVDALMVQGDKQRIRETTTLLVIRPSYGEGDLEIDIKIPVNYAIWVQPGMTFRASSLGNNPEDHGYIMGEVTFIAASSTPDEATGQRFYRMKGRIVKIEALRLAARNALLRPGSALSVDIQAGERRLINYIFDPFSKYLRKALSEPS